MQVVPASAQPSVMYEEQPFSPLLEYIIFKHFCTIEGLRCWEEQTQVLDTFFLSAAGLRCEQWHVLPQPSAWPQAPASPQCDLRAPKSLGCMSCHVPPLSWEGMFGFSGGA